MGTSKYSFACLDIKSFIWGVRSLLYYEVWVHARNKIQKAPIISNPHDIKKKDNLTQTIAYNT